MPADSPASTPVPAKLVTESLGMAPLLQSSASRWPFMRRGLVMQTEQTNQLGAEQIRLQEDREGRAAWKKWGPYLSERQWGTVREDYSSNGDAWNYFSHDNAQYRAYRWGEDGLAGISDSRQLLCFGLALWNG